MTKEIAKEMAKMCEELKRELKLELREIKDAMEKDRKEARKDFREIRSGMDFINKTFEEMRGKLDDIKSENSELRKENQKLVTLCEQLAKRVTDCESRLMQTEQYSRNSNVELKGIATQRGEDLMEVLKKVGRTVGEPIVESDVEICHRVPVPNSDAHNIIVQFASRKKRNDFLEKARRTRFSCKDLGLASNGPVFVNEHLCPAMKKLLGQAIARKREMNWRFVWVRNGTVFARKLEETPVVRINSVGDLSKIL